MADGTYRPNPVCFHQPSAISHQPSAISHQPSFRNPQPARSTLTKNFVDTDENIRQYWRHGDQRRSSNQARAVDSQGVVGRWAALGARDSRRPQRIEADRLHHRLEDAADHDGEGAGRARRDRATTDLSAAVFAGADAAPAVARLHPAGVRRLGQVAGHARAGHKKSSPQDLDAIEKLLARFEGHVK